MDGFILLNQRSSLPTVQAIVLMSYNCIELVHKRISDKCIFWLYDKGNFMLIHSVSRMSLKPEIVIENWRWKLQRFYAYLLKPN